MTPCPKPARRLPAAPRRIRRRVTLGAKRAAVKRVGTLTDEQLELITKDQRGGMCAYCETEKATTVDHVVAIARGGKHEASNVVLSCWPCNARKGTLRRVPKLRHRFLETAPRLGGER